MEPEMKKIITATAIAAVMSTSAAMAQCDPATTGAAPAPYYYGDGDSYRYDNRWNNDGYGYGDGRGYGRGRGNGRGRGSFNFSMDADANADTEFEGDGYSDNYYRGYNNWDNRYYGRNNNYRAPYGYGYPVMPMPAPQPAPAPAPQPEKPADSDNDGVVNGTDLCPDTAPGMIVDVLGCDKDARIVLRGVNFKTNSDELTEKSLGILNKVSRTLTDNPDLKVMISGHTDSDGDAAYNKDLSSRRAKSVVEYLVSKKVNADNLISKGFGEEQPIATNETTEGKALNRRVEVNKL